MNRAVLAIFLALAVVVAFAPGASAQKAPETVTLQGKTMGPVAFNHAAHAKAAKCVDCHVAATGGKLKTADAKPNAFHVAMAKSGLCVDCHKQGVATNKKMPAKCTDCHKKKG